MKNRINKWDFLNISIITLIFMSMVLIITNGKFLLGSTTDWLSQHVSIADYLRTLFLETKDIFPDFAFNLGSGQNIYNFAYYGLLNPIIMFSYLIPKVNMGTYIMFSTSILVLVSTILFYFFLKKHKFNKLVSLITSIIFLCATPILFHLHRHIMFINYMPFLILGLFGVDRYFENNKPNLLTISTLLMILISYYYSVVGIIVLIVYGIYIYLKNNPKITFKSFIKEGTKFITPIFNGVLISSILIVPTFYVILNNRSETANVIHIKDLLLPNFSLTNILYGSYGLGLTSISIMALIYLFFKKAKEKFLTITLTLIASFPIFNYIFNAGMYIDSKSLIPFLPLYCYAIAIFINDFFEQKLNVKKELICFLFVVVIGIIFSENRISLIIDAFVFITTILLYTKTQRKAIVIVGILSISLVTSVATSFKDDLLDKNALKNNLVNDQKDAINEILKNDTDIYRISNELQLYENANNIFGNINYLKNTIYSSTHNLSYNEFYYDIMNNSMHHRNRVIMSAPKNYLYLLWSGNKYLISDKTPYQGYELYLEYENFKVYRNKNVYPLAYASGNIISEKTFDKINYPFNQDILLNNIIVKNTGKKEVQSNIKKIDLKIDNKTLTNLTVQDKNDYYLITADKNAHLALDIKDLENKILFIRFKVLESNLCEDGDSKIIINDIQNKLTCSSWKYHNGNYTFDYIVSTDKIEELNIRFSRGTFKIKDIETYVIDINEIMDNQNNIDKFIFDKEKTKGDNIEGNIEVTKDGYFLINIPYDKGFKIYVDGEKTDYEKVNMAFIGFKISEGNHYIKIQYTAPGKELGLTISGLGIILFLILNFYQNKNSKRNVKRKTQEI